MNDGNLLKKGKPYGNEQLMHQLDANKRYIGHTNIQGYVANMIVARY